MGGGGYQQPATPSYGESLRDSMQAQIDLGPELYRAEAEARRHYAQLETDILRDTMLGRGDQQGMLDFMGAPAQQYTTGDVQYQPPWVDPAEQQFQRAFAPQDGQQAQQQPVMDRQRRGPLGMGPFAGSPPEGYMQQQMDAQRAAMEAGRGGQPFMPGGGQGPQQARGPMAGGQPPPPQQTFMGAEDNTGMMGAGGQGSPKTAVSQPPGGGQQTDALSRMGFSPEEAEQLRGSKTRLFEQGPQPTRGTPEWDAMVKEAGGVASLPYYRLPEEVEAAKRAAREGPAPAMPGTPAAGQAQPIMGQELASAGGAVAGAIGEGQNQRVRRPRERAAYSVEPGSAQDKTTYREAMEAAGQQVEYPSDIARSKHEMEYFDKFGITMNQANAAQKEATRTGSGRNPGLIAYEERQKAIARATGQPVPGERPPLTWEDVDAGRGGEDVSWDDAGAGQPAAGGQPAGAGWSPTDREYREAQFGGLAPQGPSPEDVAMGRTGMPTSVDMGGGVQVGIPQGTPQADRLQAARAAQYGGRTTDQSRIMTEQRQPGYQIDPNTGERTFGGLAQYGADIAEYGAGRQRAGDIRDVGRYGQEATRALRQADPLSSAILGKMSGIAGQELAGAGSGQYGDILTSMRTQAGQELAPGAAGYGGLLGEMGTQAMSGLQAQGGLTARERRNAIQSARQAAEARGRSYDPLALVGELESLEGAQRARRAEQRGFAGQTMAAEEARKGAARQYAANLLQMEGARRGEARGFAGGVLGQSRAMSADPFMAILGRPSGAGQQIAQGAFGGAQYGLTAGPGVAYNPEAGLNWTLGQQANQASLAAAQAGARGQMGAGLIGALGQLGAAKIMAPV